MRCQFMLLLTTVLIVGADDPQDEAGKLQGTWGVVSADDVPEDALQRMKVIIRRETLHIVMEGDRERARATYKLDPSQKPSAIDLTKDPKDPKGPIARGIYELDGDTLKLAWRKEGPRPTQFPTKRPPRKFTGGPSERDDLMMMVLKREKKP
jgi:uncharacterized protein (TIGR03067 family)